MDLSIIIVNWNSAAYTAECVASIRASVHDLQYEIIVVDSASSDDSVAKLQLIPGIRFIASPENLGFAGANNLGYRESSGNILLFLNPDTKVIGPAIELMYRALVSTPQFGITGCRLLNADGSLQTSCVLPYPTLLNQLLDVESLKVRFPRVKMWGISAMFQRCDDIVVVQAVSGACLMMTREAFAGVGLFSTDYFMYCEDIDLCYKAMKAGYQVGYLSEAEVVHYGGQSSKQQQSSFATVMGHEAVKLFLRKWRGPVVAGCYTLLMSLSALARLAILLIPALTGRNKESATAIRSKWSKILSWSLGRERWTAQLDRRVKPVPQSATLEQ